MFLIYNFTYRSLWKKCGKKHFGINLFEWTIAHAVHNFWKTIWSWRDFGRKKKEPADGEKGSAVKFKAKRPTGCLRHQHNTTSLGLKPEVNKQLWTSWRPETTHWLPSFLDSWLMLYLSNQQQMKPNIWSDGQSAWKRVGISVSLENMQVAID